MESPRRGEGMEFKDIVFLGVPFRRARDLGIKVLKCRPPSRLLVLVKVDATVIHTRHDEHVDGVCIRCV